MEKDNAKRKNLVEGKIILFIIGVLVGAVIATAGFITYSLTLGANNNDSFSQQMPGGGTPPAMPGSEDFENGPGGTPPELPSEDSGNQSDSN